MTGKWKQSNSNSDDSYQVEPYKWDSKNNHSKTGNDLLASSDDTKTMIYQNGVLSYESSALETTTTVKLQKQIS